MARKRTVAVYARKQFKTLIIFALITVPLLYLQVKFSSSSHNERAAYAKDSRTKKTSLVSVNNTSKKHRVQSPNPIRNVSPASGGNRKQSPTLRSNATSIAETISKSATPQNVGKSNPAVDSNHLPQHHTSANHEQHKVILLWNSFFVLPDFGLGRGTTLFEETKCPSTCLLTGDRKLLSKADSVIVHAFHLIKDLFNATIPQRMSTEQIFVFFILENPYRSYPGLMNLEYEHLFNLAFSYLDDPQTDIYAPYGMVTKRKHVDDSVVPPIEEIKKKTKLVAWLLSNCKAPSARYEYANLLEEHIPIDIFGKCGNDSCPKGEKCIKIVDEDYLFYLAFENGYCTDYITEKAFRTLGTTNMVPIVLGGANYTKHLPAHSYIDVRDFKSPKELAMYLLHLQKNLDEFMTYLQWKRTQHIETVRAIRRAGFCKLCMILNTPNYPYKRQFAPLTYWDPNECLNGDDEREALGIF